MINKKNCTVLFFLFTIAGFGQEKGDIGILFTSYDQFRSGVEYRKPIGQSKKSRLKLGVTFGGSGNAIYPSYNVFEVTDSTLSTRHFADQSTWTGLRMGLERTLGDSFFSIGGDLNLGYLNYQESFSNQNWTLNANNEWVQEGFAPFFPDNEGLNRSAITKHFFNPSFRANFNMDAPLGRAFLLNFSISSSVAVPIYMGASDLVDPFDEFLGTPSTVINWSTNVGIGLRYIIGVNQI